MPRHSFITKCFKSLFRRGGRKALFECTGVLPLITKIIMEKIERWYIIIVAYGNTGDLGC